MSVRTAFGQLEHARKSLLAQWDETRQAWTDENGRRFEEEVIAPLMNRIRQLELALNQLDVALQRAHRDCE